MLNRNTDGPDNPLSQVFSKASAQQMFWQFKNVKTEVMFWNPNWLPGIGKLLPPSIEDRLASHWGWHRWIYAEKRHLDFTRPKQLPRPEHDIKAVLGQGTPAGWAQHGKRPEVESYLRNTIRSPTRVAG
jgi:hypothetical protein